MKRSVRTLFVLGFTSAIALTTAFAQPAFTFDEFGVMTGPGASPGFMSIEPISGMATMTYVLPFGTAPGDLLGTEGGTNAPSELIRFGGGNRIWFFSDFETNGIIAPADVGLPAFGGGPILAETGFEGGAQGVFWTPGPGSGAPGDGFPTVGTPINYAFFSDVPEPASAALTCLGGILMLALRWRRQARRN